MKRLIFQVLLGTAAVLACATLAMKGGEKASARKHSKFKVIHVTPHGIAPTAENLALVSHLSVLGATIPLWNYSVVAYDGATYSGTIVGRNPFFHGHRTTTIPTRRPACELIQVS